MFSPVTLYQETARRFLGMTKMPTPTNQKTAGSKLDRTNWLMFYGFWRHLESFLWFFVANMFAGKSSQILGEKFGI